MINLDFFSKYFILITYLLLVNAKLFLRIYEKLSTFAIYLNTKTKDLRQKPVFLAKNLFVLTKYRIYLNGIIFTKINCWFDKIIKLNGFFIHNMYKNNAGQRVWKYENIDSKCKVRQSYFVIEIRSRTRRRDSHSPQQQMEQSLPGRGYSILGNLAQ